MIIEFRVKNFRSIKDEAILSLESNSSKLKDANVFSIEGMAETYRLTKSAVIYGANASGKSNMIMALHALLFLIKTSHKNEIDTPIACYEPFMFDSQTREAPCEFRILFILNKIKYEFEIKFNNHEIIEENLFWYITKKDSALYERKNNSSSIHSVDFKRSLQTEGVKKEVLKNQLFLSKFNVEPHSKLNLICSYFNSIDVEISRNPLRVKLLNDEIAQEIILDKSSVLRSRLHRLMDIADIQILDMKVEEANESEFKFPTSFPDALKKKIIEDNKWNIEFIHKNYCDGKPIDPISISLEEESLGTQILFGLGARILQKLESGGVLIYDELDNSLHPMLSRLLVKLFNNTKSNPNNAQLIFTTHEVSIMNRDMLRSDQIWFVEKNQFGGSELFSAQDFEGIREDVPFDKWYEANRFGGLPLIGDVDHVFED